MGVPVQGIDWRVQVAIAADASVHSFRGEKVGVVRRVGILRGPHPVYWSKAYHFGVETKGGS